MFAKLEKAIWVVVLAGMAVVAGWAGCSWYNQRELDRRIEEYRHRILSFGAAADCAAEFTAQEDYPPTLRESWELAAANYHLLYTGSTWSYEWPLNPYTGEPIRELSYGDTEYYGDVLYLRQMVVHSDGWSYTQEYTLVEFLKPKPWMQPGIYWRFGDICCDIEVIAYGLSPAQVLDHYLDAGWHHVLDDEAHPPGTMKRADDGHFKYMVEQDLAAYAPDPARMVLVEYIEVPEVN